MLTEDREGDCVICQARNAHEPPVCGPCRSRLAGQLRDIPQLVEELRGEVPSDLYQAEERIEIHADHLLEVLDEHHGEQLAAVVRVERFHLIGVNAGAVPGQSTAPRVRGSREAPIPINVDRLDLLGEADQRTVHDLSGDQIGYPSAATVLDGWCAMFAEERRESIPKPQVATQSRWLLDRLDELFKHPAVDELAKEIRDLWHVLRRAAGLAEPRPELAEGVPCKSVDCDLKTLMRIPVSVYRQAEFIECDSCHRLYSLEEFDEWVRLVRAPLCGRKNSDWWCARTKRHPGPCAPAGLEEVVMQKIPTLFVRDFTEPSNGRYVTAEVTPGCEWVLAGEGMPTRKYDGTCTYFDGERWWARREVKPGKPAPANFVPVDTDDTTGKTVGWEPIAQSAFAKYHAEAVAHADMDSEVVPGTYELIGPKVNGNPEQLHNHWLMSHAHATVLDAPRDFDGLVKYLAGFEHEGIVWHHPDGRMAKIKVRDFPA